MKYALIAALLLASCATTADVRAIQDASAVKWASIDSSFQAFQAGAISKEELQLRLANAEAAHQRELDQVKDDIEARTEGYMTLAEGGGLGGVLTAVGMAALSMYRNNTRKKTIQAIKNGA